MGPWPLEETERHGPEKSGRQNWAGAPGGPSRETEGQGFPLGTKVSLKTYPGEHCTPMEQLTLTDKGLRQSQPRGSTPGTRKDLEVGAQTSPTPSPQLQAILQTPKASMEKPPSPLPTMTIVIIRSVIAPLAGAFHAPGPILSTRHALAPRVTPSSPLRFQHGGEGPWSLSSEGQSQRKPRSGGSQQGSLPTRLCL